MAMSDCPSRLVENEVAFIMCNNIYRKRTGMRANWRLNTVVEIGGPWISVRISGAVFRSKVHTNGRSSEGYGLQGQEPTLNTLRVNT